MKEQGEPATNFKRWLDSPWVRVPITVTALEKTAELLIALAKSTGLFLTVSAPSEPGRDSPQ
jgi:hypothetical protein